MSAPYEPHPEEQTMPWMGGKYSGELRSGVPDGRGNLLLPNGDSYGGQWLEGKPHGKGKINYPGGAIYEGEFYHGRMHGYGRYTWPDGRSIRGLWEQGKFVKALDEPHSASHPEPRAAEGLEAQARVGEQRGSEPQAPEAQPGRSRYEESWQTYPGREAHPQAVYEQAKFGRTESPQAVYGRSAHDQTAFDQAAYPQAAYPQTPAPAIYVHKLSHWYGDLQAVKEISFDVYPGEILGFLGPNGAGKSTTIKVLTGQLALKGGAAQILGRDIGKDDPQIQAQIGVTFEEKNLYLEMTALENLDFFASLFGIRNPGSLEALRRVGLADRAKDRVSAYSKGMRQRLMIARAFINKPRVLFLDEPTDGLDPVTAAEIRKTIKEEANRGAAVLLTTHNMFEADELSNRVAFINEGRIVALDTAENLKLKYGKRSVRVRLRDRDGVREEKLPLEGEGASARLSELAASPDLMTIHTEEATLEAIFIQLTGRGLTG